VDDAARGSATLLNSHAVHSRHFSAATQRSPSRDDTGWPEAGTPGHARGADLHRVTKELQWKNS
jgi:hypothetical protein